MTSTPGGDMASTPGGDMASTPGGDMACTPGGDIASTSGGDMASNPGGYMANGFDFNVDLNGMFTIELFIIVLLFLSTTLFQAYNILHNVY